MTNEESASDLVAVANLVDPADLPAEEIDDDGMWLMLADELGELGSNSQYPKCPRPTKWKLVSQSKVRGRLQLVSAALSAKAGPATYRFVVTRSLSFSAAVTAGVKVSLLLVEQEANITLQTTVTISTAESVTFTVPKGHTMALFAGCGYTVRTFERTVYGSAMCNPVVQRTTISSPYMKIFEVRDV
jgi:hypothetical protein